MHTNWADQGSLVIVAAMKRCLPTIECVFSSSRTPVLGGSLTMPPNAPMMPPNAPMIPPSAQRSSYDACSHASE